MKILEDNELDKLIRQENLKSDFKKEIQNAGQHKICLIAARHGYLKILKEARNRDFPWDERVSSAAAGNGSLDMLQWMRENNCPWDSETCKSAAEGGHRNLLIWARKSGCPWDYKTTKSAAEAGDYALLIWAIANNCEFTPDIWPILFKKVLEKKNLSQYNHFWNEKDDQLFKEIGLDSFLPKSVKYRDNNWAFQIFLWADSLNLLGSESKWIAKVVRVFDRFKAKETLRKLKRKAKEMKTKESDQIWATVKSMTEKVVENITQAVIDQKSLPFYWSVSKKTYDFYVENPDDFVDKNGDESMLKYIQDESSSTENAKVDVTKTADDVTDAAEDMNNDVDEPDDLYGNDNDASMLKEEERTQMEADVSNGTLEFSSQVQHW